jgi:hypothetical protein
MKGVGTDVCELGLGVFVLACLCILAEGHIGIYTGM